MTPAPVQTGRLPVTPIPHGPRPAPLALTPVGALGASLNHLGMRTYGEPVRFVPGGHFRADGAAESSQEDRPVIERNQGTKGNTVGPERKQTEEHEWYVRVDKGKVPDHALQAGFEDETIVFFNLRTTFKVVTGHKPISSFGLLRKKLAKAKTATVYELVVLRRSIKKKADLGGLDLSLKKLATGEYVGAEVGSDVEVFVVDSDEDAICLKVEEDNGKVACGLQTEAELNIKAQYKLKEQVIDSGKPLIAMTMGVGKMAVLRSRNGMRFWCAERINAMAMPLLDDFKCFLRWASDKGRHDVLGIVINAGFETLSRFNEVYVHMDVKHQNLGVMQSVDEEGQVALDVALLDLEGIMPMNTLLDWTLARQWVVTYQFSPLNVLAPKIIYKLEKRRPARLTREDIFGPAERESDPAKKQTLQDEAERLLNENRDLCERFIGLTTKLEEACSYQAGWQIDLWGYWISLIWILAPLFIIEKYNVQEIVTAIMAACDNPKMTTTEIIDFVEPRLFQLRDRFSWVCHRHEYARYIKDEIVASVLVREFKKAVVIPDTYSMMGHATHDPWGKPYPRPKLDASMSPAADRSADPSGLGSMPRPSLSPIKRRRHHKAPRGIALAKMQRKLGAVEDEQTLVQGLLENVDEVPEEPEVWPMVMVMGGQAILRSGAKGNADSDYFTSWRKLILLRGVVLERMGRYHPEKRQITFPHPSRPDYADFLQHNEKVKDCFNCGFTGDGGRCDTVCWGTSAMDNHVRKKHGKDISTVYV